MMAGDIDAMLTARAMLAPAWVTMRPIWWWSRA
jgi:hypothetical protein